MINAWKWKRRPGDSVQAPISYAGDYVISHRPRNFTLSYRPAGRHVPLGSYPTLRQAKAQAVIHWIAS